MWQNVLLSQTHQCAKLADFGKTFPLSHSQSFSLSIIFSKGPLVKHNPYLMCEHLMWCDVWVWASALQPHTHTITHSYTHTHSLSLVLVVMIKAKEFKTKISLTHSLILSIIFTHIHSLSFVLVAVMKPKELKTKISHAHSLILSIILGDTDRGSAQSQNRSNGSTNSLVTTKDNTHENLSMYSV